ncbi:NTP transferase domain-containing protein [archaeon]|nr:NTP transferase domain-containing protein [archaeon]
MVLKRVTITIKNDILKKLDKMIDGKNTRNRSHAVENLILRGMSKTDLDTVVIMAGGDGARLRPITYEIPKALIPVGGRPVLEHQINMLKKFDIRNIFLAVGDDYKKIFEYFGNGSRFGVNIEYVVEQKPLGKMGSLRLLKDRIRSTFAVLNVDTLINPNIPEIYDFHKRSEALATILLTSVKDPKDFGIVSMHGNQIVEFMDRPSTAPTNLADASFYVFEPDILKLVPKGKFMTDSLFDVIKKNGKVMGFMHDGFLFDVGIPDGYEKAIKSFRSDMLKAVQSKYKS